MELWNKKSNQSRRVVLYTRRECHLCEDAQRTLIANGLEPTLIDIDTDATLRERFDTCIPVVEIDGRIRFRGHVNPMLLRRIIRRREHAEDGSDQ